MHFLLLGERHLCLSIPFLASMLNPSFFESFQLLLFSPLALLLLFIGLQDGDQVVDSVILVENVRFVAFGVK